jgi:hypothetical protein
VLEGAIGNLRGTCFAPAAVIGARLVESPALRGNRACVRRRASDPQLTTGSKRKSPAPTASFCSVAQAVTIEPLLHLGFVKPKEEPRSAADVPGQVAQHR